MYRSVLPRRPHNEHTLRPQLGLEGHGIDAAVAGEVHGLGRLPCRRGVQVPVLDRLVPAARDQALLEGRTGGGDGGGGREGRRIGETDWGMGGDGLVDGG